MDLDLGLMPRSGADAITDALHGKSYLHFRVDRDSTYAGVSINLHVDQNWKVGSAEEVLKFALYLLATEVGKGNA